MNKNRNNGIYTILVLNILLFTGICYLNISGKNIENLSPEVNGLLPALPAYTRDCIKLAYDDLSNLYDFDIEKPKSLGKPDQIWAEKHRDYIYLIYTMGKISETDLEKYTNEMNSEINIRDAGGIIIQISRNIKTNSQNKEILSRWVTDENSGKILDINGNPGIVYRTDHNSLRFYTKTTAYRIITRKSFDFSDMIEIAYSIG